MEEELVDIVDEENNVIGKSSRREAHKKGLIHRALSVLVLNSANQILLQQRSANRSIHPLSWDLSTSEHVLAGETYEQAGVRSVKELGVRVKVKRAGKINLQRRQYNIAGKDIFENEMVLMLSSIHEGPFKLDPNEVNQVNFFTLRK